MIFNRASFLKNTASLALIAAVLVVGALKPVAQRSGLTAKAAMYNPTGCGSLTWNSPQCRSYQQAVAMQNTMGWGALSPFYSLPYFPYGAQVSPYQVGPVMQPYFVSPNAYNYPMAQMPFMDPGFSSGGWGSAPQVQAAGPWGSAAF